MTSLHVFDIHFGSCFLRAAAAAAAATATEPRGCAPPPPLPLRIPLMLAFAFAFALAFAFNAEPFTFPLRGRDSFNFRREKWDPEGGDGDSRPRAGLMGLLRPVDSIAAHSTL